MCPNAPDHFTCLSGEALQLNGLKLKIDSQTIFSELIQTLADAC
jgi:hypothetical protein